MISGQKKNKPLARIEKQHWIRFGEAGRIGHQEGLAPLAGGVVPARAADEDVVGGAFAGAVKPADQQVAVGQLDHRGGMVVPVLQGKDQLGAVLRGRQRRHQGKAGEKERAEHRGQYTAGPPW